MRALPFVVAGSIALAAAAACGLDTTGLGDNGGELTEAGATLLDGAPASDDAGGNVTSPDGASSPDDTGAVPPPNDAASDVTHPGDGAPCASATEICNNGIDDNCNGLIDCADPGCKSWTCTPASVPAGWSLVEYVPNSQPSTCSPGYGSPTNVFEGPSGAAATCGCTCNVTTAGSCESGNFMVTTNGASPTCGGVPVTSPANGGACSPATVNYTPQMNNPMMQVDPAAYAPGSCTPDPTQSVPAIKYAAQGTVCADTNGAGTGCAAGGVCAPAATGGGFALCIEASGTQTCPAGFTKQHLIGTASGNVTDTRGCSACTCAGATAQCQSATLTLFTSSSCTGAGAAVQADDTCRNFPTPSGGGANPTYVAYEYTAAVQGESCPPSSVSPNGAVTFTPASTVCCP